MENIIEEHRNNVYLTFDQEYTFLKKKEMLFTRQQKKKKGKKSSDHI